MHSDVIPPGKEITPVGTLFQNLYSPKISECHLRQIATEPNGCHTQGPPHAYIFQHLLKLALSQTVHPSIESAKSWRNETCLQDDRTKGLTCSCQGLPNSHWLCLNVDMCIVSTGYVQMLGVLSSIPRIHRAATLR